MYLIAPLVRHGAEERHVELLHSVRADGQVVRLREARDLHPASDAPDVARVWLEEW